MFKTSIVARISASYREKLKFKEGKLTIHGVKDSKNLNSGNLTKHTAPSPLLVKENITVEIFFLWHNINSWGTKETLPIWSILNLNLAKQSKLKC